MWLLDFRINPGTNFRMRSVIEKNLSQSRDRQSISFVVVFLSRWEKLINNFRH